MNATDTDIKKVIATGVKDNRDALLSGGMIFAGTSPDNHIVEMIEIPDHPWFVAGQFHPEFKSRPNRPHPLFRGFVTAAANRMEAGQSRD